MSNYMADSHRDWHTLANMEGTPAGLCPFDCGAAEDYVQAGYDEPTVKCGFCGWHEPIWQVRICAEQHYAEKAAAREAVEAL